MAEDLQFGPYEAANTETYQKRRLIGQGGFAKTYLVSREHRYFAMKELDLNQTNNADLQRVRSEIRILKSMRHDNVVSYVEDFPNELWTKWYIVMEYCELGDLMKVLQSRNLMAADERFIAGLMTMLCCGMEYIHSNNVIHRDIKPQNIFINRVGVLKIGDFGVSRVLQYGEYARTQLGTPGYMSPECIARQSYSYESDMWAVGRVLFDICTRGAEWDPINPALPQRYSNKLKEYSAKLLSNRPRSRPTARAAHVFFQKLRSSSGGPQGFQGGAIAGNATPGFADGVYDIVNKIIRAFADFFN